MHAADSNAGCIQDTQRTYPLRDAVCTPSSSNAERIQILKAHVFVFVGGASRTAGLVSIHKVHAADSNAECIERHVCIFLFVGGASRTRGWRALCPRLWTLPRPVPHTMAQGCTSRCVRVCYCVRVCGCVFVCVCGCAHAHVFACVYARLVPALVDPAAA